MPDLSLTIRDATPPDAVALAQVQIDAWRAAYSGMVPAAFLANLEPADYVRNWERILTGSPGRTLVALDADGLCGYCSLGPARDADSDALRLGEIYAMYVHPRRWRDGVGRLLCRRAVEDLCASGCTAVVLWVAEANDRAIGFYKSLRFEPDGGSKVNSFGGAQLELIRYRWQAGEPPR